jgi:uncharacterized membrane protein YbhN (UPF0104 family)
MANLTFLAIGAWAMLAHGVVGSGAAAGSSGSQPWTVFLVPGALLVVPVLYLFAAFAGKRPLSWLAGKLPRRLLGQGRLTRIEGFLASAESQVSAFLRRGGRSLALAVGFFALVWGVSLAEMWLTLRYLGVSASLREVLVLMAGSRLAFLLPLPGALGVLEATQVSLFELLGLPADSAGALLVYVRVRDLVLAAIGLLAAGTGTSRRVRRARPGPPVPGARDIQPARRIAAAVGPKAPVVAEARSGSPVFPTPGQAGGSRAEVFEESR